MIIRVVLLLVSVYYVSGAYSLLCDLILPAALTWLSFMLPFYR